MFTTFWDRAIGDLQHLVDRPGPGHGKLAPLTVMQCSAADSTVVVLSIKSPFCLAAWRRWFR